MSSFESRSGDVGDGDGGSNSIGILIVGFRIGLEFR